MQKQFRGTSIANNMGKVIKVDYYLTIDNKLFIDEEKPRTVYGIEIIENGNESEIIKDVTTDEELAISMIDKIKENQVLPVHLHDVIEDMI